MTAASTPSTPPSTPGRSVERLQMTPKARRQPRRSRNSMENPGTQSEAPPVAVAPPVIQQFVVAEPVPEATQQMPKTPERRLSADHYRRLIRAPNGPSRWAPFQVVIGLWERQDVDANHDLQRRHKLLKNSRDQKREQRLAQLKAQLAAAKDDKEAEEILKEKYL
uniref:Coiled-coil domain-containing protein n=1 Tax=Panagrellus redivivus TaxID=6233 RepID=A0A7E4W6K4_PANRE